MPLNSSIVHAAFDRLYAVTCNTAGLAALFSCLIRIRNGTVVIATGNFTKRLRRSANTANFHITAGYVTPVSTADNGVTAGAYNTAYDVARTINVSVIYAIFNSGCSICTAFCVSYYTAGIAGYYFSCSSNIINIAGYVFDDGTRSYVTYYTAISIIFRSVTLCNSTGNAEILNVSRFNSSKQRSI